MGRKIRLLWTQETDTEVYFRIQVHMDSSQYAAIGEIHSALKLEKSAITKIQKHIFCNLKNGGKNQFLHQKKVRKLHF